MDKTYEFLTYPNPSTLQALKIITYLFSEDISYSHFRQNADFIIVIKSFAFPRVSLLIYNDHIS